jgi:hypothetical protein
MSEGRHGAGCADILFRRPCPSGGEVALEDYARALTRASSATALSTDGETPTVRGVHLCGLTAPLEPDAGTDVEAFARELAERSSGGLGWS